MTNMGQLLGNGLPTRICRFLIVYVQLRSAFISCKVIHVGIFLLMYKKDLTFHY